MNQLIFVYELMNLYLYHNSNQKTSPEYTLKFPNQYKTTFYFPTVIVYHFFFLLEVALNNPASLKGQCTDQEAEGEEKNIKDVPCL